MGWLISLTLLGALITPVHAQSADDKELLQYRLTAEVLAKAEAVARAFDANVAKDPKMKRRMDAQREIAVLEKKDNLTAAEETRLDELEAIVGDDSMDLGINGGSLSEMAAQLQKVPAMAAALKTAGMLPRDMAKFIVTAVQSSMILSLGMPAPQGGGENMKFVAANMATIERINKLLGAK